MSKDLGYSGVRDPGLSIIHGNEPAQTVFFPQGKRTNIIPIATLKNGTHYSDWLGSRTNRVAEYKRMAARERDRLYNGIKVGNFPEDTVPFLTPIIEQALRLASLPYFDNDMPDLQQIANFLADEINNETEKGPKNSLWQKIENIIYSNRKFHDGDISKDERYNLERYRTAFYTMRYYYGYLRDASKTQKDIENFGKPPVYDIKDVKVPQDLLYLDPPPKLPYFKDSNLQFENTKIASFAPGVEVKRSEDYIRLNDLLVTETQVDRLIITNNSNISMGVPFEAKNVLIENSILEIHKNSGSRYKMRFDEEYKFRNFTSIDSDFISTSNIISDTFIWKGGEKDDFEVRTEILCNRFISSWWLLALPTYLECEGDASIHCSSALNLLGPVTDDLTEIRVKGDLRLYGEWVDDIVTKAVGYLIAGDRSGEPDRQLIMEAFRYYLKVSTNVRMYYFPENIFINDIEISELFMDRYTSLSKGEAAKEDDSTETLAADAVLGGVPFDKATRPGVLFQSLSGVEWVPGRLGLGRPDLVSKELTIPAEGEPTVFMLVNLTESDILKIKGVGRKALGTIKTTLKEKYGLELKPASVPPEDAWYGGLDFDDVTRYINFVTAAGETANNED